MKTTKTPGGLLVISSDEIKHRADDKPKKDPVYFVAKYDRFEEANRHMHAVRKDGGEVVNMTRHGKPSGGIIVEEYGYVITYFNHRQIEVEVKT